MANPVDLVRELADALSEHLPPSVDTYPCNWSTHGALLTNARAFLEQARVIEVGERYTSGDGLLFLHGIETDVPDDTPCTVHVVVQVGGER